MTKETSTPDSLEAQITAAPANVTVFSDGSTFDYEEGYKSNGAPVATRDRTDNPTIMKTYQVVTANRVFGFLGILLILSLLVCAVALFMAIVQGTENWKALKAGVDEAGQVEVVQSTSAGLIVKRPDGGNFKCDVSMISNNGSPVGLVFCGPQGNAATFTIPLPHDPNNVLYVAPLKEKEKSEKAEK